MKSNGMYVHLQALLIEYLGRFSSIADNSINCGPVLNWLQMDNKGHRLLVPSEESRSINTPAVAAAYSVRRYVSQVKDGFEQVFIVNSIQRKSS